MDMIIVEERQPMELTKFGPLYLVIKLMYLWEFQMQVTCAVQDPPPNVIAHCDKESLAYPVEAIQDPA